MNAKASNLALFCFSRNWTPTYTVTANPAHGILSGTAPDLTYSPAVGYMGPDSLQFTVKNTANLTSSAATVSLNVAANSPPVFTSVPTATPNPATVEMPVQFTAAATGAIPVTYAWDFGDGSQASGASVSHIYSPAGTYSVTVTATDATKGLVSATLKLSRPLELPAAVAARCFPAKSILMAMVLATRLKSPRVRTPSIRQIRH